MENDPDVEWEFYIGEKLGKFIYEIQQLPNKEFMRWQIYFARKAQRKQLADQQKAQEK